jgi:predicted metal-binding membrane protein
LPNWIPRETPGRAAVPATFVAVGALGLASGAAWLVLVLTRDAMPMQLVPWIGLWTVMMAAMMLPSAAPVILLYGRQANGVDSTLLMVGYVLAWSVVGIAAYELDMRLPDPGDAAVTTVLIVAGIYQLTPLKSACLKQCRNPLDFLVTHWRSGHLGAARLGVEHGAYCIGCCWALMVSLFALGVMSLAWMALVAALIAFEKTFPWAPAVTYGTAALLAALAILVVAAPGAIPGLTVPGGEPMGGGAMSPMP